MDTDKFVDPVLMVSPQKRNKSVNFPEFTFTWIDIFIVVLSMTTFIADIVTDVLLMLVYWKNDEEAWAALTLAFFVLPAFIMQVFSVRWYLADGHKVTWQMVVWHLFMMGPIMRYIDVLRYGFQARKTKRIEDYQLMYSELSDVSMLRLFECFLESAPQLVLQLHIMIRIEENDYILTGISACFSLLSLSWAIVAYTRALRAAATTHRRVSWTGAFLHGVWRGGMLLARLTAIVMFASVFQEWTLLFLGLHWLLMTSWIICQDTDFCNTWWEERLFNLIIGIIYVFCFFNMKEGKSRHRVIFYYSIILIENTVMIILWWSRRTVGKWYNVPALSSVWGGFALGLLGMILYYIYFHPASKKRCHCCMPCRILTFRCQSCCHRHHDITLASPYKKVNTDRNFFDSTESSDEILDCRDFTELRSSYVEQKTNQNDSSISFSNVDVSKTDNCLSNFIGREQQSTPLLRVNDDSKRCIDETAGIMVVGDAQTGFRIRPINSGNLKSKNAARKNFLPLPNLTSTPSDPLRNEPQSCQKNEERLPNTPATLPSTPAKVLRPKSPNTLVKKWVKETQELYEAKKVCFSPITESSKNEAKVFMNQANGRRNPLRMKSFSKKDRVGHKPSFLRTGKRQLPDKVRNSFREAFGFNVIDLDKISDDLDPCHSAAIPHITEPPSTIEANTIRSRIDKPPSPPLLKDDSNKPSSRLKKLMQNSPPTARGILKRDEQTTAVHTSTRFHDKENSETSFSRDLEANTPSNTKAEQQHHSARKKLAFKSAAKDTAQCTPAAFCKSPCSASPRRALGSIENRC